MLLYIYIALFIFPRLYPDIRFIERLFLQVVDRRARVDAKSDLSFR